MREADVLKIVAAMDVGQRDAIGVADDVAVESLLRSPWRWKTAFGRN
jgi:hypothetical protein